MKILITGDSHTGAIQGGLELLQARNEVPAGVALSVTPIGGGNIMASGFFADESTHARITSPSHRKSNFVLPLPDEKDTWYGVCAPMHTARVVRSADWGLYSTLAMPEAERPLSASAMRRIVRDDQKYILKFFEVLLRNKAHVFVVDAPHPFRHHRQAKHLGAAKLLAIDREYRAIARSELTRLGVPVVDAPAATLDEDGFTRDEFRRDREGDQHHGNNEFGALMLKEVVRCLQDREHTGQSAAAQLPMTSLPGAIT